MGDGKEHTRGVLGVAGVLLLGGRKGLCRRWRWFSLAARGCSWGRGRGGWGRGCKRKEERREGREGRRVLLDERWEVEGREEVRVEDMVCWRGGASGFEVRDLRGGVEGREGDS